MISVSLWQVVLFVLAGVAVGVIMTILTLARGSHSNPSEEPVTVRTGAVAPTAPAAATISGRDVEQDRQARSKRAVALLRDCIAKGRNLTVSEAAKILDVSPRRVRRSLDGGALIAVPTIDGQRLVSAVSILDLVVHALKRETLPAKQPARAETGASAPGNAVPTADAATGAGLASATDIDRRPGPRQMYWYFVEGHNGPLRSIREALKVLGLDYAYTDWVGIPKNIRDKMRRERVQSNEPA